MGFLSCVVVCILLFQFHSFFLFTVTNSFPLIQHRLCHEEESYALLQFKEGFLINRSSPYNTSGPSKITSWNASTDCCSWDGIECDEHTGHVSVVDLRSSHLYGYINSNSTLFSLLHLQSLDLADNDFNHSQIPSRIGELSKLIYLNLSQANFFGEIPPQISHLSNLLSLDLSSNTIIHTPVPFNLLRFKISILRSFIQNSTNLEILHLDYVIISSFVPRLLTNLTSLKQLSLYNCEMYGEFPGEIFQLPKLTIIDLGYNRNLVGQFPDFQYTTRISTLRLPGTSFHGTLPASIGNLKSLSRLSLSNCKFYGSIPSSLGNLTQVTYLDLADNQFKGDLSSSMAKLTKLQILSVGGNEFTIGTISWVCRLSRINALNLAFLNIGSELPSCFVNLTQLSELYAVKTNLSGEIPSWIMNLTNLAILQLDANNLQGEIPESLFKLENLESLGLSNNLLEGELEVQKFLDLKKLTTLSLSFNKLSLVSRKNPSNVGLSRIQVLGLSSCNLVEFPSFLQGLPELSHISMSINRITSLPRWIYEKNSVWKLISVSHNSLTGKISPLICDLKFLEHLDLSFNNLSGTIPSCLGSFNQYLKTLKLNGNKLSGTIPQAYMTTSALIMIDLSDNNLQGELPRGLVNCSMLEYLDVSHNYINDLFPFWLGSLPELKVVALHDNRLRGSIRCPTTCTFPKLHIIDLSHNQLSGSLPSDILQIWKSMEASNMSQLQYELPNYELMGRYTYCFECNYSFTMSNKGRSMIYERLQQFYSLISIDLSYNRISGKIPEAMGDLTGLIVLNLSNNMFSGSIPPSLRKLSKLESLDLSVNNLSGNIPQQLTQLTSLSYFSVSFNNLSGPIPEYKQFSTFESRFFEGNKGLCGNQLIKKCVDTRSSFDSPSAFDGDHNSGFFLEFNWEVVLIGYGGGLVVGLVLGSTFSHDIFSCFKRVF